MLSTLDVTPTKASDISPETDQTSEALVAVAGTSLLFSILQSVCGAVVAINGVRLAIGLSSLAMTAGVGAALEHFHHITWLRILLLVGGVTGSLVTLAIPIRSRRLRHRPSARWRYQPLTPRQRRMEALQITLSILTLLMAVVEECLHFKFTHSL